VTIHQIFPQKFIDRDFQRAFATHIPIFMIRSAFYILNKVISVTAGTIIILHKRYKEIMADDYGIRNTVYIPIGLKEIRGLTKQEAKKVLGIEDKFMLLFFGFVAPFKGIDFALEAVRMIDQQVKERIVFIAAGSKLPSLENNPAVINYTQALKKQAIGLPVVFKDYYIPEREAETLFSAADLVLIPYQKQSGPSEIFKKAALYKIPVIASNIDYLAEDIRHMVTGILVSTDSPVHMAEAVEKLYSNQQLYHSIQVQLKKVAQEFDIRNTAQSHADLYHAVCFPRNIT
jgi:glycosyltransferase involved in cell wall biosynthesis